MKSRQGFTLVELLVVMTIIAMLAAVIVPVFNDYIVSGRRNDAINTLRENQLIVEAYRTQNGITPTSGQVTLATTSPMGFYTVAYTRVSDDRYTLVATAVATKSQDEDTGCTTITLSSDMDDIYPAACH